MGYVKATETNKTFTTFTAEKQSKGTSWGAVYAQFEQKAADASAHGEGFTIERELLCNGKPVSGQSLKVGDKVTVRITIRAERDYDFVQVSDKRAACLESAEQLSGYRGGSYCSPKDNATYYYFDHMRKGTHTLSNTYYVDRSGVYQTGTCTVQCAYSPEFMARSTAPVLTVQ